MENTITIPGTADLRRRLDRIDTERREVQRLLRLARAAERAEAARLARRDDDVGVTLIKSGVRS